MTAKKTRKAKPTAKPAPTPRTREPKIFRHGTLMVPVSRAVQNELSSWLAAIRMRLGEMYESVDHIRMEIDGNPEGEIASAFQDNLDRETLQCLLCHVEQAEMAANALRIPVANLLPRPVAVARRSEGTP